jgi:hypothetical protein
MGRDRENDTRLCELYGAVHRAPEAKQRKEAHAATGSYYGDGAGRQPDKQKNRTANNVHDLTAQRGHHLWREDQTLHGRQHSTLFGLPK